MARRKKRRLPRLTPDVLDDDEKLVLVIGDVVQQSPELVPHYRRVRRKQDAARKAVGDDHWLAVLALDDAHVDRLAELSLVLVRWGFNEGRRFNDVGGQKLEE